MSCTDPTDPSGECAAVLHDVWLFLDDELDPHRRAVVQRHLDECSPCLQEAGIDEKLKRLLQAKCGGEIAPQSLRERVTAQLFQATARVTVADRQGATPDATFTVAASSLTLTWETAPASETVPAPGAAPADVGGDGRCGDGRSGDGRSGEGGTAGESRPSRPLPRDGR